MDVDDSDPVMDSTDVAEVVAERLQEYIETIEEHADAVVEPDAPGLALTEEE